MCVCVYNYVCICSVGGLRGGHSQKGSQGGMCPRCRPGSATYMVTATYQSNIHNIGVNTTLGWVIYVFVQVHVLAI